MQGVLSCFASVFGLMFWFFLVVFSFYKRGLVFFVFLFEGVCFFFKVFFSKRKMGMFLFFSKGFGLVQCQRSFVRCYQRVSFSQSGCFFSKGWYFVPEDFLLQRVDFFKWVWVFLFSHGVRVFSFFNAVCFRFQRSLFFHRFCLFLYQICFFFTKGFFFSQNFFFQGGLFLFLQGLFFSQSGCFFFLEGVDFFNAFLNFFL